MAYFKASTQYGDWRGTASADDIDPSSVSVRRYIREKNVGKPTEFLIAVEFFLGETHHSNDLPKPFIHAYFLDGVAKYEEAQKKIEEYQARNEPIPVRQVDIDISLEEFFGMFKRFAVTLTWQDLPIADEEYRTT
jgi:hypothetical protein